MILRAYLFEKLTRKIGVVFVAASLWLSSSVFALDSFRPADGCFAQPYGDGSFCLLTEDNLREGILLPQDSSQSSDLLGLLDSYLNSNSESPYDYFKNESFNIHDVQRKANLWALATYQRYYAGYVAGGANTLIPANAFNGYQLTQDLLHAGVFTLFGARGFTSSNSQIEKVGENDPLGLIVPMSTVTSTNNYLSDNASNGSAMASFGLTSSNVSSALQGLNDVDLLINYIVPMLRSCHMTFKPYSLQSTCRQTIYDSDTNETTVVKFDNSTPLSPNQIPRGSSTPPTSSTSSTASQAASTTDPTIILDSVASDGTITEAAPLSCSMQTNDVKSRTNGMQSMMSYIGYYQSYIESGDMEQYFLSDYPTTHTYKTKKEAMVCLTALLQGLYGLRGVWTPFKNWRTFAPPNVQQVYCASFLNLEDSPDKSSVTNFLDQMIPAAKTDEAFLVTDPSPGIMAALVLLMYKFQFQLHAQMALVASQNTVQALENIAQSQSSQDAILLPGGYPTLPFLTMRSEPQPLSCKYEPMSVQSKQKDLSNSSKVDASDPEYLSQALKMDLIDKTTSVDLGLPIPGYEIVLPKPATYTLSSGTQVLDVNQLLFLKNGRVMRYASYSPTFMGVVTSSTTTQRAVSLLNEKFANHAIAQQQITEGEINSMINSFNAAKARNAMQRATVAYALEAAVKSSILKQRIDSAKSLASNVKSRDVDAVSLSGAGGASDNICRYSFDDNSTLQTSWRLDTPNQYLATALDISNDEGTMDYADMMQQSQKIDLLRDMAYNLAWKIYMGQKKYELQEFQIALKATELVLTQQPTIESASSSGVSTNDQNVWKFYTGAGTAPTAIEGGSPADSAAAADPGVSPEQQALVTYPANVVCPNVSTPVYTANEADFVR